VLKGIGREATYYYHPDHLGSVSVVSNHRGEPYERVEYLPFGEIWIEETDPATGYIPFRFTSKELDEETGLYYYGARYYEPATSRWISPDPAGFGLINPMGSNGEPRAGYSVIEALNWYSYTSNNPVLYVDPTGEKIRIRGSIAFRIKVRKTLRKIRSKPEGKKLVKSLRKSKNKHYIEETDEGNAIRPSSCKDSSCKEAFDGGSGSGSTTKYNPDKKTRGTDSKGSDKRPPFIGLAHELGHAEAYDKGMHKRDKDDNDKTPGTTPPSEEHAMERENEIREEHGLNERPSYYPQIKKE